jgi:hypothetical protein
MSKIEFDVYAIELNEDNIPEIIEAAKPFGWTLNHLQDNMEFNAEEDGADTILFMKLYHGTIEIATFVDESEQSLDQTYRMTNHLDPKFGLFYKIEKI